MYIGKHSNPEQEVDAFNNDVKAYIDLYFECVYNCGFNPERIQCWNTLVREMREYRENIVRMLYAKGIRTSILNFNGKYEMVGTTYKPTELFPF